MEHEREIAMLRRQLRRERRRAAVLETEAFLLGVTAVTLLCLLAILTGSSPGDRAHAGVAQQAERRTENPAGAGSTPAPCTTGLLDSRPGPPQKRPTGSRVTGCVRGVDRAWTGAIDSQETGCAKHTLLSSFQAVLPRLTLLSWAPARAPGKRTRSAFLRAHARTSISFPGRMVRHAPGGAQSPRS